MTEAVALSSLNSRHDILAALRTCESQESAIDSQLDAMLADAHSLNALLGRLEAAAPQITAVEEDARDLALRIDNTAEVAERISGQVRSLDDEQTKVKASIDTVQAVQDLKVAIALASQCVEKQDWEAATRHMQRALAVDQSIVQSSFSEAVVPTSDIPQPPAQAIQELRAAMVSRFLSEFQSASQVRDEANTSRYFKLFPMIAAEREGLDAYANFVCSLIASRPKPGFNSNKPMYFASLITPLFEHIALIISQHQPVVEKYYGPSNMLPVAVKLQHEGDQQGVAVLAQWVEERKLNKKLSEANAYRFQLFSALTNPESGSLSPTQQHQPHLAQQGLGAAASQLNMRALNASLRQVAASQPAFASLGGQGQQNQVQNQQAFEEPMVDTKDIDALLHEISQISGRWQLYRRFLYARLSEEQSTPTMADLDDFDGDANTSAPQPEGPVEASLPLVEESAFKEALHSDLRAYYEPLELWYFRVAVEKAHSLDEPDFSSRPTTSSVLDDVFFMLKKVVSRVIATGNVDLLESAAKKLRSVLEKDFGNVLRRRMDVLLPQLAPPRAERERTLYITYLNDLELAADYANRLMQGFLSDHSLEQVFFVTSERTRAEAALLHIKGSDEPLKALLKTAVEQFFATLIRPRLRPLVLECYKDISYVLDEDSHGEAEFNDYVRKRFIKGWSGLLEGYRELATETNHQTLFSYAVSLVVRPWEATVKGMRFTELGALRLDRDLRSVISYLSEQVPFGAAVLRDSFARLQQIATLLSSEPEDVSELVTSNGWRLTQSEMNSLLALKASQPDVPGSPETPNRPAIQDWALYGATI